MSNVIIELAHHLSAGDAERLGLPAEDLIPTTEVVVTEDVARSLVGAGYAANVEPERVKDVAKALRRKAPADHPVGLYQAPKEQGEDAKPDAPAVSAPINGAAPKRGSGK